MHSSSSCSLHKHCKPDCVDHNQFICSLRKYQKTSHKSTKSVSHIKLIDNKNNIRFIGTNSTSSIRPFRSICEDNPERKNQQTLANHQSHPKAQIESYLLKVRLPKENKKHKLRTSQIKEQVTDTPENKKLLFYSGLKNQKIEGCMVEEKQFKQLQVNVDRISQIIEMFNKKIGNPEQNNSTQKLMKTNENTAYLKPFIITEEEQSLSKINSFNCTFKQNSNNLLGAQQSLNNLSQNDSKPIKSHKVLNYQMNNIADKTIFTSVYLNRGKA